MLLIPALNVRRAAAAAAAVFAIGCSKEDPPAIMPDGGVITPVIDAPEADAPPVVPPDAPPGTPATMTVRGTGTVHWVGDNATVDRPFDLSRTTFTSFTPTATGFEHRTGTFADAATAQFTP